MADSGSSPARFFRELRRRRVLRTAGLYIVGAWLVLQAADVFFPGWGLPDSALNVLLVAAILGFPLALVFGWFFDVTTHGIVRTPGPTEADTETRLPLQRADYVVLSVLVLIAGVITFDATREILETPRLADDGALPADDVLVEAPANSVAVLPFANISNEPENEAFCDGISEEILNKLGSLADLHVIGRTSSFVFKNSEYRIPQIAALLGTRYLLQGSVRKYGDQLRISAQLVDETGAQRWSDTFDRQLENIFDIQTEIADAVAGMIASHITPHVSRTREPDLEAYTHYLIGRDLWHKRNRGALEELRKAVELDPDFAAAQAEFAIARLFGYPSDAALEQADRAIERALELEPGMPRALAARGLYLQQQRPRNWSASEPLLREALEGNPSMTDAMNWLATALNQQGKTEQSHALLERAYAVDPFHGSISTNLAFRYFEDGQVERAEGMMLRQLEVPNPSRMPFISLSEMYEETGLLVKMNEISKRLTLTGLHHYGDLARNYALLDDWDQATYWTNRTIRDFPEFAWAKLEPANVLQWQGKFAEAVTHFDQQIEEANFDFDTLPSVARGFYGQLLVFAGELTRGVEVLEQTYGAQPTEIQLDEYVLPILLSYAWALQQLGRDENAANLLDKIDAVLTLESEGNARSRFMMEWVENAALRGETDLALDRLQQAVADGWRGYYVSRHDPKLATLRNDPRFQAMMIEVRADIERQRAIIDELDSEEDLVALLDQVQAARERDGS